MQSAAIVSAQLAIYAAIGGWCSRNWISWEHLHNIICINVTGMVYDIVLATLLVYIYTLW